MNSSVLSRPGLKGPRGYPILGVWPMLRSNTLGFLKECSRTFGDIVPLRLPMTTAYLLNHPAHVEHVLQTNYRNYSKCAMMERLKPIFGNGLVTSDDELWTRQRKLMQPSFHRVRRQNIWRRSQRKLAECGPRLGVDVRRRACGVASADA